MIRNNGGPTLPQASRVSDDVVEARASREVGDQVNRYLLCTLVSESARCIRASAEMAGEHLPMPRVVRSVLRSYRMATKDKRGPFAEPLPDMSGLARLNARILAREIALQSQDRIRKPEATLDDAKPLGDGGRAQPVSPEFELALAARGHLTAEFGLKD